MKFWNELLNDSEFWESLSEVSDYRKLESDCEGSYFISCDRSRRRVLEIALYPTGKGIGRSSDPTDGRSYIVNAYYGGNSRFRRAGMDNDKGIHLKQHLIEAIEWQLNKERMNDFNG